MVSKSLFWLLSSASLAIAENNKTSSDFGPLEIDLIFPRNETYAPTHLVPVVFATQKPGHLFNDTIADIKLGYSITRLGERIKSGKEYLHLDWTAHGDKGIDFHSKGFLDAFSEGTWVFSYDITWFNCTPSRLLSDSFIGLNTFYHNNVTFTTKNGSRPMDIAAEFNKETCKDSQSITMQIDRTWSIPEDILNDKNQQLRRCAVMNDVAPPARPCNVVLTPEHAHDIMKEVNATTCEPYNPGTDLYNPTDFDKTAYCQDYSKHNVGAFLRPLSAPLVAASLAWLLWLA